MRNPSAVIIFAGFVLTIAGCTLSGEIWRDDASSEQTTAREVPDFVAGERLTTTAGTPGFEINAVVGDVDVKSTSLDGRWEVEGVFYE